MKSAITGLMTAVLCSGLLFGCGEKADENQNIEAVKAEAAKLDKAALQQKIDVYTKAIDAKKQELEKIAKQLKDIPPTELLGEKASSLKAELEKNSSSISKLTERMNVYSAQLNSAAAAK